MPWQAEETTHPPGDVTAGGTSMLRIFWRGADAAPAPSPGQAAVEVELTDDELEHVAGGLERVYPNMLIRDLPPTA